MSETGSTNDDLIAAAEAGGGEQALIADLQTAGRGRRDRVWKAASGSSVLASVLVHQPRPEVAFWAIGAAALAIADAIDVTCEVQAAIKWPNDLLIDGAKVAGILAALSGDAVVVGSGINANWPRPAPPEFERSATAINHHSGFDVDRGELVAAYLAAFEARLALPPTALVEAWRSGCATLGSAVRLMLDDSEVVGTAVDIESDGALVIESAAGRTTHRFGDVIHLRPA